MTDTPDNPAAPDETPDPSARGAPAATPIPLEPQDAPQDPKQETPDAAPAPGGRPGPTSEKTSLLAKVAVAAADIKIAHSVFALPFALLAAFLAGPGRHSPTAEGEESFGWIAFAGKLVLIVLCMVFARTWAMLVNRIADRRIDAKNPRTAKRAFAEQRLSTLDGLLMLAGSGGLFVGACAMFVLLYDNSWPLYASLPVLGWIAFYSFTKRFTLLCHLFLGGALAVSPVAAAVAVDPSALSLPSLWMIALMVLCWVAGFDVIYALQDVEFDTGERLHSIPAKLGPKRAITLSRMLHLACVAALLLAWWFNPNLGQIFGFGVGATVALLVGEHLVLAKRGEAGLQMAFFTFNGILSVVLGAAGIVDVFY